MHLLANLYQPITYITSSNLEHDEHLSPRCSIDYTSILVDRYSVARGRGYSGSCSRQEAWGIQVSYDELQQDVGVMKEYTDMGLPAS
jgi:hypothetical protein